MRCPSVRRKLMAYHDRELGQRTREKLRKHLARCPTCSGLLDFLEKGDDAAGTAGFPDPGRAYWDTFTDRVMDKVRMEARINPSAARRPRARGRFSPLRLAPAFSVALMVLVTVGILMKVRQPGVPGLHAPSGETVVRKESPPAPVDHIEALSETKGTTCSSAPAEAAPARKTGKPAMEKETGAAFQEGPGGMFPGKRKSAAGEMPRASAGEEANNITRPGSDEALSVFTPGSSLDEETRKSSTALDAEVHRSVVSSGGAVGASIPERSADDGSWGQLLHARQLADQGKNRESEDVLNDLLERNFEPPIQEEASLLLVAVLERQSRVPEARKVLERAQRLYPANTAIQNFRLEEE
jgi:hypothetical protein